MTDGVSMNSPKIEMVEYILRGIDAIESADPEGWWETSTGANFGARKLEELRALFSRSPAPVPAKAMSDQQGLDTGSYRVPLYTHADPGEVERLRIERGRMDQALVACANERDELRKANTEFDAQVANDFKFIDDLRAQLAEAQALLRDTKRYIERNDYPVFDLLKRIDAHLSASAESSAPAVSNLPELTDDLREILGRPNFTCHFIAKALRVMGHSIAPKSEDEQAVVIHWLLGHYLKNGSDWRLRAEAELKSASEKLAPSVAPQQ